MEAYLNVVELGDGIYGAEAASRHYWGISANQLSKGQSALLAAALPNPLRYSITRPGPYMQKRKGQILNLMPKMGKIEF
jgi:monofunctional biosynthetic peptidoglycan transglycosylase